MLAPNPKFRLLYTRYKYNKHKLFFPTSFPFMYLSVPGCFFTIYISFLTSFSSCISFFHAVCSFLYTCAFLVKLVCSPLLQSLQSFVLHLRVPTTNTAVLFTCSLASLQVCPMSPGIRSLLVELSFILLCQIRRVVLEPTYNLVAGCFFRLTGLRRELMSQAVGTTLVQATVVPWSSRFC